MSSRQEKCWIACLVRHQYVQFWNLHSLEDMIKSPVFDLRHVLLILRGTVIFWKACHLKCIDYALLIKEHICSTDTSAECASESLAAASSRSSKADWLRNEMIHKNQRVCLDKHRILHETHCNNHLQKCLLFRLEYEIVYQHKKLVRNSNLTED